MTSLRQKTAAAQSSILSGASQELEALGAARGIGEPAMTTSTRCSCSVRIRRMSQLSVLCENLKLVCENVGSVTV